MHLPCGTRRNTKIGGVKLSILGDGRHAHNHCAARKVHVVSNDDVTGDHTAVLNRHGAAQGRVACDIDGGAYLAIVADVDLIVDLGAVTNPR